MAASPTLPTAVRPPVTVTAGVGRELSDFKKIFRDLRLHVDVGVRLHHARRTDSDRRFSDVFEALNTLLPSVEGYQKKLSEGAPRCGKEGGREGWDGGGTDGGGEGGREREGERGGGREEGREGGRKRGREEGRKEGREGERKGGREGGRRGRKEGREL